MSPQIQAPPARRRWQPLNAAARLIAALGLALDGYVHLALAGDYDANLGTMIGQGALFRIEAAAAAAAALLVLLVHRRGTDLAVLAVAGSAAAAVLLYRYLDPGPVLGLPNMYEPVWFPEKTLATAGELLAALATLVLLRPRPVGGRSAARHRRAPEPTS